MTMQETYAGGINAVAAEHVAQNILKQLLGQQQVAAAAKEGTSPELIDTRGSSALPCMARQNLRVQEGQEMELLALTVLIRSSSTDMDAHKS